MFNKAKIALSVAIVLVTASAAMAATKHPIHHRVAIERQISGASAYGYASVGNAYSPSVLDALKRQAAGDPRCRGGNCDPVSGSGLSTN